jgi:hypothetical protein
VLDITREITPTIWKRNIRGRSRYHTNMEMFLEDKLKNRSGIEYSLQRGEDLCK